MHRKTHRLTALGLLLLAGCRSAESWKEESDRVAYELVLDRRAKLGIGDASFTIDRPADSLREQLLRGEVAETPALTLAQCLEIAAENSREYQTRREALYLAALDVTLERWRLQVHKTGIFAASVSGEGDEAETATEGAALGLSKILGTGAAVIGNIGLGFSRSLTTGDSWNPVGELGLLITQPLLRGSGSLVVTENLTQSERDLVYEVRTFERFRRTFALDVAERFYALLQQRDEVQNQEANFENVKKLSERNAALSEAGRLDDIEAGQARQRELSSRNDLLAAQARLAILEDAFRIFLGLPPHVAVGFDSAGELERLLQQDLTPIVVDEDAAAAHALAARLDHQNALGRSEDSARKVLVAEDALRAGLSLTASWDTEASAGPAEIDFKDSTWTLAAALDLPIDRLAERNAYRSALIASDVALRNAELSADVIRAELREDMRQSETQLESYRIQQNAVELAERRIESTDLKLQAGRADTRDLLEAQESLLDARNGLSSALIDYTLSRLELFLDLELLRVDEQGIHLESPTFAGGSPDAPAMESASASAPGEAVDPPAASREAGEAGA